MGEQHPDLAAATALVRSAGLTPPADRTVEAVRDYLLRLSAFTGRTSRPLADERLLSIAVKGRGVPCKLYWPDGADRPPLMVYCHGGGFRHGAVEMWDAPLRQLVRESGVAVLSVGYALAPEHPFPAAFDEVTAVLGGVMTDGAVGGLPVAGFAVGGDSAGANLALGSAIAMRDAGLGGLAQMMLLYGVYSKDLTAPSWGRLSGFGGHGLSAASMATYWETYTPAGEDDWRVQPLHADLSGLPPARITVGDLDPLVDENMVLAEKLGPSATLTVMAGVTHGVVRFNEIAPVVRHMLSREAEALRAAFA